MQAAEEKVFYHAVNLHDTDVWAWRPEQAATVHEGTKQGVNVSIFERTSDGGAPLQVASASFRNGDGVRGGVTITGTPEFIFHVARDCMGFIRHYDDCWIGVPSGGVCRIPLFDVVETIKCTHISLYSIVIEDAEVALYPTEIRCRTLSIGKSALTASSWRQLCLILPRLEGFSTQEMAEQVPDSWKFTDRLTVPDAFYTTLRTSTRLTALWVYFDISPSRIVDVTSQLEALRSISIKPRQPITVDEVAGITAALSRRPAPLQVLRLDAREMPLAAIDALFRGMMRHDKLAWLKLDCAIKRYSDADAGIDLVSTICDVTAHNGVLERIELRGAYLSHADILRLDKALPLSTCMRRPARFDPYYAGDYPKPLRLCSKMALEGLSWRNPAEFHDGHFARERQFSYEEPFRRTRDGLVLIHCRTRRDIDVALLKLHYNDRMVAIGNATINTGRLCHIAKAAPGLVRLAFIKCNLLFLQNDAK